MIQRVQRGQRVVAALGLAAAVVLWPLVAVPQQPAPCNCAGTAAQQRARCKLFAERDMGRCVRECRCARFDAPRRPPRRRRPTPPPAPEAGLWGTQWVRLPGGRFQMGSTSGYSDAKPVHRVRVGPFAMMKSEVTVGMYRACVAAGKCGEEPHFDDGSCYAWDGSTWKKGVLPQSFRGDTHPVVCVDWSQATAFCSAAGGRLPSEAEWEYAASGGEGRKYPWGSEEATCARAVMNDGGLGCGEKRTWPVCSKRAGESKHGLCDLAGNVWEWTQDCWHRSYGGAPSDGSAWTTGCEQGDRRVVRGGSWFSWAGSLRAAYRDWFDAGVRLVYLGFRCVRPAPPHD